MKSTKVTVELERWVCSSVCLPLLRSCPWLSIKYFLDSWKKTLLGNMEFKVDTEEQSNLISVWFLVASSNKYITEVNPMSLICELQKSLLAPTSNQPDSFFLQRTSVADTVCFQGSGNDQSSWSDSSRQGTGECGIQPASGK